MTTKSINKEKSSLKFTGYALGGLRSHVGTFGEWEGKVNLDNKIVMSFEGVAKISSVSTGIEKLEAHLKSPDFFDAGKNPEIKFKSTSIKNNKVKGKLKFRGTTLNLEFPIKTTKNSISSEFKLNIGQFGFSKFGVKKRVKITFNFVF